MKVNLGTNIPQGETFPFQFPWDERVWLARKVDDTWVVEKHELNWETSETREFGAVVRARYEDEDYQHWVYIGKGEWLSEDCLKNRTWVHLKNPSLVKHGITNGI